MREATTFGHGTLHPYTYTEQRCTLYHPGRSRVRQRHDLFSPWAQKQPSQRTSHLLSGFWLQISLSLDGVGRRPVLDFCLLVLFLGLFLLEDEGEPTKPEKKAKKTIKQPANLDRSQQVGGIDL